MLRKKSEIGRTSISKRQVVSVSKMKETKDFLREYFDVMDVPDDEDGLIAFIIDRFTQQKAHYEDLNRRYDGGKKYPDRDLVQKAIALMDDVLSQQKDNIALIDRVIRKQDDLFDNKEAMVRVEGFFKNQVTIFDAAAQMEQDLRNELDYLSHEPEAIVVCGGYSGGADLSKEMETIAELQKSGKPMLGIGLGHQLLAISQGADTKKLLSGHRGGNQPIEDLKTGLCYITSQNHGYEVDKETLPANASLRFVNRNDGSCEGIDYMDMPAFSVQFQPAATGGLYQASNVASKIGTHFLFDRFIALMGGNKECR